MALQEAAVYRSDIISLYASEHDEDGYFLASRPSIFSWTRKNPQSAWWFFVSNESNIYMADEEAEFIVSHDGSLSFPTPKLGAKTRTC